MLDFNPQTIEEMQARAHWAIPEGDYRDSDEQCPRGLNPANVFDYEDKIRLIVSLMPPALDYPAKLIHVSMSVMDPNSLDSADTIKILLAMRNPETLMPDMDQIGEYMKERASELLINCVSLRKTVKAIISPPKMVPHCLFAFKFI